MKRKVFFFRVFLDSPNPDPYCLLISESAKQHKSLCKPNYECCQVFNLEPDSLVFEFSAEKTNRENTSDFLIKFCYYHVKMSLQGNIRTASPGSEPAFHLDIILSRPGCCKPSVKGS